MIAIDEMNVPKGCFFCRFCIYDHCIIMNGRDVKNMHERPDWCPIKEIGRCKDCKHWWKELEACLHDMHCDGNVCSQDCGANDFCSDWEIGRASCRERVLPTV